jgi:hypothetical protein
VLQFAPVGAAEGLFLLEHGKESAIQPLKLHMPALGQVTESEWQAKRSFSPALCNLAEFIRQRSNHVLRLIHGDGDFVDRPAPLHRQDENWRQVCRIDPTLRRKC